MRFSISLAKCCRRINDERGSVRCAATVRQIVALAAILGTFTLAPIVSASVLSTGNVLPADNPFSPNVNEGLPTDGNFINPFELPQFPPVPSGLPYQTYFEGRHSDGADPNDQADDTNINFDVQVGVSSFGSLLISGESSLRDQNLIIGDITTVGNTTRYGTGVVRITGYGSLYNNDPTILPAQAEQAIADGLDFHSVVPRATDVGFDLYVGRNGGTGTLEISAGARAEIQDAVFVGYAAGATGSIVVDGFDSFLGSGSFAATSSGGGSGQLPSPEDIHQMLIGPLGTGTMTVTNGATVSSFGPATGGNGGQQFVPFGAVIGSYPSTMNADQQIAGGTGTVTIVGSSPPGGSGVSKWIIGGSLQVGGFSLRDTTDPPGSLILDPEGDQLRYSNAAGRGTLYVKEGGLVSVISTDTDTANPQALYFVIGKFGRVEMSGGAINVGGAINGTDPNQGLDRGIQTINDGLITGSGTITTGTFLNRYLGEVRVDAGQKLIINAVTDFRSPAAEDPRPLTNYGRINAYGTVDARAEIEFERFGAQATTAAPLPDDQPFYNRPLPLSSPLVNPSFDGGQISAQHATLRFHSGIQNRGLMAFTAGENVVSGRIDNVADADNNGRFLIERNTTVTSEDDFASGGLVDAMPVDFPILTLREGSQLTVLNHSSFTLEGHLDMELSHANPAKIEVAGNVGLNANLYVSFDNDTLSSLHHGDAFELLYFAGFIGGVNNTDPTHLVPDLTKNPVLNVVFNPTIALLHPNLDLFAVRILQSYYLLALDPTMVGSGAVGPDFNGDGVINLDDLAIWEANVGCETGCSVLQGDADGDGDVDGDDFLFWQRNVGQPMPWTGSGSAAAVPEPTTLMLLALGLMALPAWRRR